MGAVPSRKCGGSRGPGFPHPLYSTPQVVNTPVVIEEEDPPSVLKFSDGVWKLIELLETEDVSLNSWNIIYREIIKTPKWTPWRGSYDLYYQFLSLLSKQDSLVPFEKEAKREVSVALLLREVGFITHAAIITIFVRLSSSKEREKIYTHSGWGIPTFCTLDDSLYPTNNVRTLNRLLTLYEQNKVLDTESVQKLFLSIPNWMLMQHVFFTITPVCAYSFVDRAASIGCWEACYLALERGVILEPKTFLIIYRNPYRGCDTFFDTVFQQNYFPKMDALNFFSMTTTLGNTHPSFPKFSEYLVTTYPYVHKASVEKLVALGKREWIEPI
eukprot:TRINITY_DN7176_c0_g1_i4.p1 TRINITY_DN7176_c0_g1~~TRINITY_DN7176_c0_g1_i4.p1  ORF type:complete len:328 (-),score=58.17 TRINITY_DN7176_c0_g1_i4:15-998(-)